MDNEANIPEDYNNQGIDVNTTDRRDAENCVLCNLKDRIQNNKSLLEATRTAEKIGDATPMIINSIYKAKEEVEENTRNPKYINADTIKDDMQNESRTIGDVNTESTRFPGEFNEYGNEQFGQQFNEQSNGQFGQQFNEQSNEQFGQQFNEQSDEQYTKQPNRQFGQQRNSDWER